MIIRIFPQMKLKASSLNNRWSGPPADRAEERSSKYQGSTSHVPRFVWSEGNSD